MFIESNIKWQVENRRESTEVLGKLYSDVSDDQSLEEFV